MPTPQRKGAVKPQKRRRAGRLTTYSNPAMTREPASRYQAASTMTKEKGVNFQDRLEVEQQELESEIRHTLSVIHRVKRDTERLLRKQTLMYGATLDNVVNIKRNTDTVKQTNQTLYQEMEHVKALHSKLESDLHDARAKYDESTTILNEGKKETKKWTATEEEYLKCEASCNELVKTNRNLRVLLIKHHINPNTNAEDLGKHHEVDERGSIKSCKSLPANVTKRKMFVKTRNSTMSDLRHSNGDEMITRSGTTAAPSQEQMNPDYLGFYRQLRDSREMKDNHRVEHYRTGIDLPKIELMRGKRTAYGSYINLFQLDR